MNGDGWLCAALVAVAMSCSSPPEREPPRCVQQGDAVTVSVPRSGGAEGRYQFALEQAGTVESCSFYAALDSMAAACNLGGYEIGIEFRQEQCGCSSDTLFGPPPLTAACDVCYTERITLRGTPTRVSITQSNSSGAQLTLTILASDDADAPSCRVTAFSYER